MRIVLYNIYYLYGFITAELLITTSGSAVLFKRLVSLLYTDFYFEFNGQIT